MDQPAAVADDSRGAGGASRLAVALSWSAWLAALAADLIGAKVTLDAIGQPGGFEQGPVPPIASAILVGAFSTVGLLLRHRRPDHVMGWLFLTFGLVAGISNAAWGLMVAGLEPGATSAPGQVAAWLGAAVIAPVWVFLAIAIVLLFPDGRPGSPFEGRLLGAAVAGCLTVAVGSALAPGTLTGYPGFVNPITLPAPLGSVARVILLAALAWLAVVVVLALAAMVGRYRTAPDVLRHQIRWFAYGAGALGLTGLVYVLFGLLIAPKRASSRDLLYILFVASATVLPVAVLFAITRRRLYEIDRLISRTLVYGALTAILAGLYAASVRLFNAVFVGLTGDRTEAALVLTTLVLATTFTPIKGRLERLVGRRFGQSADPEAADRNDLDARIEAIARRVAQDVLAERVRDTGER